MIAPSLDTPHVDITLCLEEEDEEEEEEDEDEEENSARNYTTRVHKINEYELEGGIMEGRYCETIFIVLICIDDNGNKEYFFAKRFPYCLRYEKGKILDMEGRILRQYRLKYETEKEATPSSRDRALQQIKKYNDKIAALLREFE